MNIVVKGTCVAGAVLVAALGGAAAVSATPSSTITVQDEGGADGAQVRSQATQGTVDSDGTQGSYKQATDGTASGPLEDAVPQYKAGK